MPIRTNTRIDNPPYKHTHTTLCTHISPSSFFPACFLLTFDSSTLQGESGKERENERERLWNKAQCMFCSLHSRVASVEDMPCWVLRYSRKDKYQNNHKTFIFFKDIFLLYPWQIQWELDRKVWERARGEDTQPMTTGRHRTRAAAVRSEDLNGTRSIRGTPQTKHCSMHWNTRLSENRPGVKNSSSQLIKYPPRMGNLRLGLYEQARPWKQGKKGNIYK